MGRVIHFEITANDVERASAFYESVFGWSTTASPFAEGYHLAATGDGSGIDGAIMRRDYKQQPTIVWVEVDDIDAAMAGAIRAGGGAVNEKNTIPGEGQVAYIRDTEGNLLGLRQTPGG